jgi:hypothetical protein
MKQRICCGFYVLLRLRADLDTVFHFEFMVLRSQFMPFYLYKSAVQSPVYLDV